MKDISLFIFVFGAVIFTSIQAKEEVAKHEASKQISNGIGYRLVKDKKLRKRHAIYHLDRI